MKSRRQTNTMPGLQAPEQYAAISSGQGATAAKFGHQRQAKLPKYSRSHAINLRLDEMTN